MEINNRPITTTTPASCPLVCPSGGRRVVGGVVWCVPTIDQVTRNQIRVVVRVHTFASISSILYAFRGRIDFFH